MDANQQEGREKLAEIAARAEIDPASISLLGDWVFSFQVSGDSFVFLREHFPGNPSRPYWDLELRLPIFYFLEQLAKGDDPRDLQVSVIPSNKALDLHPLESWPWAAEISRTRVRRFSEKGLAEYASHLTSCVREVFDSHQENEAFILSFDRCPS